jgi:hypothetical protein
MDHGIRRDVRDATFGNSSSAHVEEDVPQRIGHEKRGAAQDVDYKKPHGDRCRSERPGNESFADY